MASSGAVCASVASLVTKNPSLWRSSRALVRCTGEDFVAGLLAVAAGSAGWHRDPKKVLVTVFAGCVVHEAAKAVQEVWRARLAARRRAPKYVQGYRQLELAAPATRFGPARPPALVGTEPPGARPLVGGGGCGQSNGRVTPPMPPSPRRPETPRNKSNPRPVAAKAVPLNPIQALKQRRVQQQYEVEERRHKEAGPLVQVDPLMQRWCDPPSEPSTPRRPPSLPRAAMGPCEVDEPSEAFAYSALTPLERRAVRKAAQEALGPPSPLSTAEPSPMVLAMLAPPSPPRRGGAALVGEVRSAPVTGSNWRPPSAGLHERPRPASQQSPDSQSDRATDRLRERMKQRESGSTRGPRRDPSAGSSGADWRTRIEMRQHEDKLTHEQEQELRQQSAERSGRRNDALRRVMERQSQRQGDVACLEA